MASHRTTRMLGMLASAVIAGALIGAAALPTTSSAHRAELRSAPSASLGQHLAAAAYLTPANASWDRLIATGSSMGFVVVNVSNGPGDAPDASFASVIERAHAAGIRVLGYVDTGYLGGSDPVRETRAGDTDAIDWMAQAEQDVNR